MSQNIANLMAFPNSFSYLVTVLGATSVAVILGWRWWKSKHTFKSLRSLPSPPKHWLLGNIPQVLAAVKQKKYGSTGFSMLRD